MPNARSGKTEPFDMKEIKHRMAQLEVESDDDQSTSPGYLESLPLPIRRRVGALEHLQQKHSEVEAKFRAEMIQLEKKYLQLYTPIYAERTKLIKGEREPTAEETAAIEETGVVEVDDNGQPKSDDSSVKGVPLFWVTALKNHPAFASMVTKEDEVALAALQDIRVQFNEGNPGFKLEFVFGPNDYFENRLLTKTYYLENPTSSEHDDLLYDHAEGTSVQWREGKSLCFRSMTKTQRHRQTGNMRTIRRTVATPSFFHFFSPPAVPKDDEEMADIDPDELDDQLQTDYELGDLFKSKIIPRAVDWFTGKALAYEDITDGDDEDYDEEEDGSGNDCCDDNECADRTHGGHDDEDDDDEGEDEGEETDEDVREDRRRAAAKPSAGKPPGSVGGGSGAGGKPGEAPQCKQQ